MMPEEIKEAEEKEDTVLIDVDGEEFEDDDIEDKSANDEQPPVVLYNEQNTESADRLSEAVDPNALSISMAVSAVDFISKVNVFLDTYGDAMKKFKEENSEEWSSMIVTLKKTYQQQPYNIPVIIELISALTLEFKQALLDGTVESILSKKLYELSNQTEKTDE